MKDRPQAPSTVQQFAPIKKVTKNLKYAQKYGGQDETDSDSSKDLIAPPESEQPVEVRRNGDYSDIKKTIAELTLSATPQLMSEDHRQIQEVEPFVHQQSHEDIRKQAIQSGGPDDVTPKETMTDINEDETRLNDDFVVIEKK